MAALHFVNVSKKLKKAMEENSISESTNTATDFTYVCIYIYMYVCIYIYIYIYIYIIYNVNALNCIMLHGILYEKKVLVWENSLRHS